MLDLGWFYQHSKISYAYLSYYQATSHSLPLTSSSILDISSKGKPMPRWHPLGFVSDSETCVTCAYLTGYVTCPCSTWCTTGIAVLSLCVLLLWTIACLSTSLQSTVGSGIVGHMANSHLFCFKPLNCFPKLVTSFKNHQPVSPWVELLVLILLWSRRKEDLGRAVCAT